MAPPSFDCMPNLFCIEEPTESIWDDEIVSHNDEEEAHLPQEPSRSPIPVLPVEDDEAIAVLIENEACHMPQEAYPERFRGLHLDAGSRWDAINWILKVQAHYNFGPLTAYLSVNYLDRFLSSHQLLQGKAWMLQLLSIACVSLAAKMEEPEVPVLLDLQVGEVKYVFEACTIQRMELMILSILKWRLSSVTPFSYVGYLLQKIGMSMPSPNALVLRVTELILATCRFTEFLLHRPSVIAIASVICVCEEFFQMHELLIDPFWTSKKAAAHAATASGSSSISISSAPGSPVGVLDAAACASSDSDSGKTRSLDSNTMSKQSKESMEATTAAAAAGATATTTMRMRVKKRKFVAP